MSLLYPLWLAKLSLWFISTTLIIFRYQASNVDTFRYKFKSFVSTVIVGWRLVPLFEKHNLLLFVFIYHPYFLLLVCNRSANSFSFNRPTSSAYRISLHNFNNLHYMVVELRDGCWAPCGLFRVFFTFALIFLFLKLFNVPMTVLASDWVTKR